MIQFTEVNKQYGDRIALRGINLHIEDGVCFGLIGPNGAGKSTLMKILCNILGDYKGEVSIFGQML